MTSGKHLPIVHICIATINHEQRGRGVIEQSQAVYNMHGCM